jgi:uncharacterized protein
MSSYLKSVRRTDRQRSEVDFFHRMMSETMACTISINTEDYPISHLAFFAYEAETNSVSFHFSKHGQAGQFMTDGKKVCISVFKCGKLYTGKSALDFGSEYQSIIIYGTIRIITDENERMKTMHALFEKFFANIPKDSFKSFSHKDTEPLTIVHVSIEDWFGKEHLVPENATDSFYHSISPLIIYPTR